MPKKVTKQNRILKFIKANPDVPVAQVAKEFGVTRNYIYVMRSKAKNRVSAPSDTLSNKMKSLSVATTDKPLSDMVNHPAHYKAGGVETIDFIEAKGLGYHLGNAVKYISRAGLKGTTNGLEDLRKAQWYLTRAIEKNEFPNPTR
jgi:hypothetical protein